MSKITKLPQNMTFINVFPTSDTFISYYKSTPFYGTSIASLFTDSTLELIYILLYNRYGNNEIINESVNQFKSKLIGVMWASGPKWIQRINIQEKLDKMSLEADSDIYKGSTAVYNHAMHPEEEPSTNTDEELTYINDQNVTKYKKSKLEGLVLLSETLNDNYTDEFINRFRKLFKMFIWKNRGPIYITEDEEDEE